MATSVPPSGQQPIVDVARELGIAEEHVETYGRNKAKMSAPPMTEMRSLAQASNASPTLQTFSAPGANQFRFLVRTRWRRPGSNPGRLSKVLRPITMTVPIVSALNRLRSAGMCQGSLPARPMIPLRARATTMVISGLSIQMFWPCRAALPSRLFTAE